MRACSPPGGGRSAPLYVQLAGPAKETEPGRQSNETAVEAPRACVNRSRLPACVYGWTTYCAFVGSSASAKRANSTSISRFA
jgi:hypothetical protein